ncbi:glycosyl hydrolase family 95 catalytic domain-containing protein [Parasediminibacterium sp. JCM 36343]|uniref:glycosyl hydrolase family 95 catalytic domain-containing protein n=1 Tax=Parasediminibacterium sp. JCM 36343 TaxID=3374279 RepID=UPI0039793BDD
MATDTSSNYTPAYLGNGIIGIRSQRDGLGATTVTINGLYDFPLSKSYIHLIDDYNPLGIKIILKNGEELVYGSKVKNWQQSLNLKEGILATTYEYDNVLSIKTQLMALRNLPVAAMEIFEFEAKEAIEFRVQNGINIPNRQQSQGLYKPTFNFKMYKLSSQAKDVLPVMSTGFPTESGLAQVAGANTFYFEGQTPILEYARPDSFSQQLSFKVSLKKGEKYHFCLLSSFQHSNFSSDPYNDAIRICGREYHLGFQHQLEAHKKSWAKLWESDIVIDGDTQVQLDIRNGLYTLYSSIAEGFQLSIPPCGIANEWGAHIFWDADTWMFPPLLVLQPELAHSIIDFRFNTLAQSQKRAAQFGYKGAMYAWESDLEGNECTSINYKLDMTEHHITADVANAAADYYKISKDKWWLRQKGFPIIREAANFWLSRVSKDAFGKYHINNVVGPDEYFEDVNDDAFTNAAVKIALNNATKYAKQLNEPVNLEWKKIADNIIILQHKDGFTLQNSNWQDGRIIKQADVNLLAFPMGFVTNKMTIRKDLEYYEPLINPNGPSMSYSVLAGCYAQLGDTEKAYTLFLKAYRPNLKPPFGIFTERPTNNVSSFCTGYGGILQTVIFGFGGIKIGEEGVLKGKANLPAHWKKMTIKRNGFKDLVCINGKA